MNDTDLLLLDASERFREIAEWWVELHSDRLPGSRRRQIELNPTAEQVEQRAALERRERAERDLALTRPGGVAPLGHSPAPARLDVLDVVVDSTYALLELEDNVREYLQEQIPARRPLDPRRYLEPDNEIVQAMTRRQDLRPSLVPPRGRPSVRIHEAPNADEWTAALKARGPDPKKPLDPNWRRFLNHDRWQYTPGDSSDVDQRPLEAARWLCRHAHRITDQHLAEHVEAESRRILFALRRATGTAEQVLRLPADCPLCQQRSLRMFKDRDEVACVSNSCRCDEETCPCHDEPARRHRWKRERWGWLSKLIGIDLYDFGRKAS